MARTTIGSKNIISDALDSDYGTGLILTGSASAGTVAISNSEAYRAWNTGTASMFLGGGTAMVAGAGTAVFCVVPPSSYADFVVPASTGVLYYMGLGTLTIVRHGV